MAGFWEPRIVGLVLAKFRRFETLFLADLIRESHCCGELDFFVPFAQFHQRVPKLWVVTTGLGLVEHCKSVCVGQMQQDRLKFGQRPPLGRIPFASSYAIGGPAAANQRRDKGSEVLGTEGQKSLWLLGGLLDQQGQAIERLADDPVFAPQMRHLFGKGQRHLASPDHPRKKPLRRPLFPCPIDLSERRLENFEPECRRYIPSHLWKRIEPTRGRQSHIGVITGLGELLSDPLANLGRLGNLLRTDLVGDP